MIQYIEHLYRTIKKQFKKYITRHLLE